MQPLAAENLRCACGRQRRRHRRARLPVDLRQRANLPGLATNRARPACGRGRPCAAAPGPDNPPGAPEPVPRQPSPIYLAVGLSLVGVIALGLVIAKAVTG